MNKHMCSGQIEFRLANVWVGSQPCLVHATLKHVSVAGISSLWAHSLRFPFFSVCDGTKWFRLGLLPRIRLEKCFCSIFLYWYELHFFCDFELFRFYAKMKFNANELKWRKSFYLQGQNRYSPHTRVAKMAFLLFFSCVCVCSCDMNKSID